MVIESEPDIIIEERESEKLIDSTSLERALRLLATMARRSSDGFIKNQLEDRARGITADGIKGYSSRKMND